MRLSRIIVFAVAIALLASGCAATSPPASLPSGPVTVVATTTVFADIVKNVGGDLVDVASIVPKNGDVHTFEPTPADARRVAGARLLVMNGLGLDDWLEKLIVNVSASGTPLVRLGVGLPGVELLPGEAPGTQNPHLWMNVKYAELYAGRIAEALKAIDPSHAVQFDTQLAAYLTRLDALDAAVRTNIATIPEPDRKLVMFHDAFPYFARAYGVTVVGVAVEAPGQDPSAAYTAELITAIKAAHVKVIFSENQFPTKLVDQLAAETGAKVVSDLYDDALSDDVPSYEALITWDSDHLVAALR